MSTTISEKRQLGFLLFFDEVVRVVVFFFNVYVTNETIDCSLLLMWIIN